MACKIPFKFLDGMLFVRLDGRIKLTIVNLE